MTYDKCMFSFLVAIIIKYFMEKGRDDKVKNRQLLAYVYFTLNIFHINRETHTIEIYHILVYPLGKTSKVYNLY